MSRIVILVLMTLVIALPFLFRPEKEIAQQADVSLVLITPHNESIRYEFTRAFREWYLDKTGKVVELDWRVPGGTSEIVKYINSEFTNAFRNYWTKKLNRNWSQTVQNSFDDPSITLDDSPEDDTKAEAARRAFLESNVSCGLDIFFGGGSYDFILQANAGRLAPTGILEEYPERFSEAVIPQTFKGETFYSEDGSWVGAVLSTFGILYNNDLIKKADVPHPPTQWADLSAPAYFAQLGVSDPTKSGSTTKAFEMIVQQQMQLATEHKESAKGTPLNEAEQQAAIEEGWGEAMHLIQMIAANARYFTDSATKPVIDVSQGNCAVGMCIDFYGRYQEENIAMRTGGKTRVTYVTPRNGSTVSTDPVGMFRGAPNREAAAAFIDFVTSEAGQKLWDYKQGAPGGPQLYTLRRPPIRRDFYTEAHRKHMADPEVNPYTDTGDFVYHSRWTGPLFSPLRFIIRTAFIDPHDELTAARKAILEAEAAGHTERVEAARKVLTDLSLVNYTQALTVIRPALKGKKIEEVQMAKKLGTHFSEQYRRAREIAEGR